MQLPPALHSRLAGGPGAAEPLPVERDPAAGAPPFRFAARRVRFPREHEFFEDGDVLRHLYLQDVLTQVTEAPERPRVPEFTCQVAGCCQVFDSLEDYEHHYHTLHRNVCSFCRRAFPSVHLLDVHILEWHDSLFQILSERQDMYQCLVEGCAEKFKTSKDRKDHLSPSEHPGNRVEVLPAQPHPGPLYEHPQKLRGMTGSNQEGMPWKSALNTRPPSQSLWASDGPPATEYLLPSVSVKVHHEDLKAPRKKRDTSDNVDGEPQNSKLTLSERWPFAGWGVSVALSLAFWRGRPQTQAFATLHLSPAPCR
ncbi:zinc finger protein 511 isoform X1 [Felis catus]|uniref:zinc finger protein 511 isoform X1 n=1 Tax=Felis catus TaxID=9685 RepID=UPI001D1A2111|nr:zinc finger protein 511 isoform X1 [Felis catus]